MQSDLQQSCAEARSLITVPAVPIVAIRTGAQRPASAPSGGRRKWLLAALLAGAPLVAVGAVAGMWSAHVSIGPSGDVRFTGHERLELKRFPTSANLRAAVRQAAFPAELPTGLPSGTRPTQMVFGPSIILISYRLPGTWRGGIRQQTVILTDPRSESSPPAKPGPAAIVLSLGGGTDGMGQRHVQWLVGGELVILPDTDRMTPAELAHFRGAMLAQAARLGGVPRPR